MIRKIRYPNNGSFESKVTCIHHYESSIFIALEDRTLLQLNGDREYNYDRHCQQLLPWDSSLLNPISKMAVANNILWCYTDNYKVERWAIWNRKCIDVRIPVGVELKKRPSPSFFVPDFTLYYGRKEHIDDIVAWGGEILASHGDGIFNIWTNSDKFDCLIMEYSEYNRYSVSCLTIWNDRLCFFQSNVIYVMKKPWEVVFTIKPEIEKDIAAITPKTDHLFIVYNNAITKWDARGSQIQVILQLPTYHYMLFDQSYEREIGVIVLHGNVMAREKNRMYMIHKDVEMYDQLVIATGKNNTTIDRGICGIHTDLKSLVIWKIQPTWTPKLHSTFPMPIRRLVGFLMIMATKRECQLHVLPKDILLLVAQFSVVSGLFKSDDIITATKRKMATYTKTTKRIEPGNGEKEESSTEEPQKKRKKSSN